LYRLREEGADDEFLMAETTSKGDHAMLVLSAWVTKRRERRLSSVGHLFEEI
jgi:hypothetical protein